MAKKSKKKIKTPRASFNKISNEPIAPANFVWRKEKEIEPQDNLQPIEAGSMKFKTSAVFASVQNKFRKHNFVRPHAVYADRAYAEGFENKPEQKFYNFLKKQKRSIAMASAVIVAIIVFVCLSPILFPQKKIDNLSIFKPVTPVTQISKNIVAGQMEPVKWVQVISVKDLKQGQKYLKVSDRAKDVKITAFKTQKELDDYINGLKTKNTKDLTLNARQDLSGIYQGNLFYAATRYFSIFFKFLAADLSDAVGGVADAVSIMNSSVDSNTDQGTVVDLSQAIEASVESPAEIPADIQTGESADSAVVEPPAETPAEIPAETTDSSDSPVVIEEQPVSAEASADQDQPAVTESNTQNPEPSTQINQFVAVEYVTSAPVISEQETDTGKIIKVSSPDEAHGQSSITDVVAHSNIPEIYKVGQEDKIKIKWKNEGNQTVTFHAYDLNNNGKLDYVEWTVPHLSDQYFEIILISKAFELDESKQEINDIYDIVKEKDNNWASLPAGHYIRATFQQTLDNTKDITLYAKPTNLNTTGTVEVYEKDTNNLIAEFPSISQEGTYRILLTNLQTPSSVFDLKIVGDLDIDWVVDPVGWLTTWPYRKKITVSNTNVDADLTNFPVLVRVVNDSDMGTVDSAGGDDIRFTDSGGTTLLKYEREKISGGMGSPMTADFWVKVPLVTTAVSTDIYIYYGKADATGGQDAVNVWDSNYVGVWHMPNGSTLSGTDSTSNNNTATAVSAVSATDGIIDGGGSFAGSDDYFQAADSASLKTFSTISLEAWVYPTADGTNRFIMQKSAYESAPGDYLFSITDGSKLRPTLNTTGNGWTYFDTTTALGTNAWYHASFTYNGSTIQGYLNGVADGSASATGSIRTSADPLRMGCSADAVGAYCFTGKMDEVRISNVARSAAWMEFEYCNMTDSNTTTCGSSNNYELAYASQEVPPDRFWIGGTGNWNDTAHWSLTTGGSGGASVPDGTGDVTFDSSSGTGTVTINTGSVSVVDLVDSSANIEIATSTNGITVTGDLTVAGTISGATAIILSGSAKNIYGAGTISAPISMTDNHTIDSSANITISGAITITAGKTITNSGVATVSAAFGASTGAWTQDSTSTLNFGGATFGPTLTATATGNTINYTSSSPATIKNTDYYNLTVNQAGTTFTAGGAFSVNNNLTVTAGTFSPGGFTITGSGASDTLNITGTLLVDVSTFSGNYASFNTKTFNAGSIVNYSMAGDQTVNNLLSYVNVTISGSGTKTLQGNLSITGDLTVSSGTTFSPAGYALTGSGTNSLIITGTLLVDTTAFASNYASFETKTFNAGSIVNYSKAGDQTIVGSLLYVNLTTSGSGTKSLDGACTITGDLTVSSGTTYNPNGYGTTGSGTNVLNVTGTILVDLATFATNYVSFDTKTFNAGSTVNYSMAGSQTVNNLLSYVNLTISGSGTKTLQGDLSFSGDLTLSGGTLDTSSGNNYAITLTGGNWVKGAGSFEPRQGEVVFLGANQNISASNFYNFTISGTGTKTLLGAVDIGGYLKISSTGNLDVSASNYAINVAGNWNNEGGTFQQRSGTITLDGSSQTILGSTTFYDLTKSVSSTDTLTFTASTTQIITHTLTLNGASSNLLSLRSSSTPTQWSINPQATRTLSYLDVKDSNNLNATAINMAGTNSTNSLNNTNWTFNTAPALTSVADTPDPIKGGATITITPTGQADTESDNLYFYCAESTAPTSATTLCTQANASYASAQYGTMTCTYAVTTGDATRTIYCRTYDGTAYSTERTTTYVVDSTLPVKSSFIPASGSIIKTTEPSITFNVSEPSSCRASTTDKTYSQMSGDTACFTSLDLTSQICYMPNLGADGTKNVYIACADSVENEDNATTNQDLTYTLDATSPTTTDDYTSKDNVWQSSNQTITLTPADATSGVSWTKYCLTSSCDPSTGTAYNPSDKPTITAEGTTYFRYASQDNATNTQTTVQKIVKIDKSAPTTTASAGSYVFGTESSESVTVTLTCDDGTGAGCGTTLYCTSTINDCTPDTSYDSGSKPVISTEGTSYIRYVSLDTANNAETPVNSKTIIINSNSAPTFSTTSTSPDIAGLGSTITFLSTASDVNTSDTLTLYVCKSNDFTGTVCGAGGEWCHSSASVSDPSCQYTILEANGTGTHSYYAYIIDNSSAQNAQASGNPKSSSFQSDMTPPVGSDFNPASASTTSTTPLILFALDEAGDCKVSAQNQTYDQMTIACSGTTSISCRAPELGVGSKNVYVSCKDYLGNKQTGNVTLAYTTISSGSGGGGGYTPAPENQPATTPTTPTTPVSPITQITEVPQKIVDQVVNIGNQIQNIVNTIVPEKTPETIPEIINLPPITEVVPEKTPLAFTEGEALISTSAMQKFVFAPLPESVSELVGKFPQLKNTFSEFGLNKVVSLPTIKANSFNLPTLNSIATSLDSGVKLADLPKDEVTKIPSAVVFASMANEKIGLSTKISISETGEAVQSISAIQNQMINLTLKSDKPARKVLGYVIFKSAGVTSEVDTSPVVLIPTGVKTASLMGAVGQLTANSVEENKAESVTPVAQKDFVLETFEYKKNANGIYTASIQAPTVIGKYEIRTKINYTDASLADKQLSMEALIDPEGYIFKKVSNTEESRILGSLVTIYRLNNDTKQYEAWNAKDYNQLNPQSTDITGRYSFLVPEGYYYIKVEHTFYNTYIGKPFYVQQGDGVHENIELVSRGWQILSLFGPASILIFVALVILAAAIFASAEIISRTLQQRAVAKQ